MMEMKEPLEFSEQLEKLKSRGCAVSDDEAGLRILKTVNYYRLTAYLLPFKVSDNEYAEGTTLTRVHQIYEFDAKLRSLLYSAIERIEVHLRATIAYRHAHQYGTLGYMNADNFIQRHNHEAFTNHLNAEIDRNRNTLYVKHHLDNFAHVAEAVMSPQK